jgi:transcriptional regulator with XRE-family HTH domain
LSQSQLADKLSKSRTAIVNWETGYAAPGKDTISLIASVLDVSAEWLCDTSNDEFEAMEMSVADESPEVMTTAKKIGARLRYFRKRKGLSGEQVAKFLKVSRATISGYETGNREPNFETLILLSELYDMPIDSLFGISSSDNDHFDDPWMYELMAASKEKQDAIKKIWEVIRNI